MCAVVDNSHEMGLVHEVSGYATGPAKLAMWVDQRLVMWRVNDGLNLIIGSSVLCWLL